MRLLYVLNARIPSERAHALQVMKTCEAMAKLGIEVTLTVPWRFGRIKQDPLEFYGIRTSFPIRRLPSVDLSRFGRFGFLVCSFTFSMSLALYLLFVRHDIIFGRDELPLLVARFLRKRIVWEAHDGRYNVLTRLVLPRLTGLVTITNGLKNFYESKGYNGSLHVAPDGVDLNDFSSPVSKEEARDHLGLSREGTYVLYIGSLQPWKGCDTFFAAAPDVPNARFIVVGGYPNEIAQLEKAHPTVTFLGERPYRELPIIQRAADVLVIPNTAREAISAQFTSPLKAFAHMASDVPIIASNVPSLREVFTNESVYFFEPDNPNGLSETIRGVLDNHEEALRRANVALKEVRRYTWIKRAQGIAKWMNTL